MGRFSQKGLCYSFEILQGLLSNKNIRIPMKKKKLGGPSLAPQKSRFWADKSRNGPFLPEGFCYSFEISQGLLSNKKIRIPTKIKFQGPPQAPRKSRFWADKSRNGLFLSEGFVLLFGNFAWAPK